jgi:ketosteroid isomerase-like protein
MSHLDTVRGIYEAFGRGDIAFILDQVADDVQWESWEDNHGQKAGVPTLVPRSGRDGVVQFFEVVGGMEIRDFQVLDLLASERQVAVEVMIETDSYRDEELHLWTFGDEGKVTRLRHYVDTAKHIAASGL